MDMSLIEAQDASEIVIQAAGNDVNIMLGTAIDPNLKDEIRVTVVATGVAKEDADEALGLQPESRRQPNLTHNSNMQHAQTSRPMQRQQQPQATQQGQNQSSAFGDWDIRRETSTRQNVSNTRDTSSVTSFGGVPTTDEDLDTPPFFRKN